MKVKIGLEIHVQLNTKTKIFCSCVNPVNLKEEAEPNSITCECCLGLPGAKPTVNRKVVEMGAKIALALGCKINNEMFFSRKNYFYPDLPKNYQITQYEVPLSENGKISIDSNRKKEIRIKRVHIEEDAAKTIHIGGMVGGKYSLIDYNRSGVPVAEIVTEPDISSPEEARMLIQKLITTLEYLEVYNSISKAVIKSDANISVNGGNKVEVKEITGAKELEEAAKYEIIRQKNTGNVIAEVRAWNPEAKATHSMRLKEGEEEYGYIFEPDLTKIILNKDYLDKIRKNLPELPDERYNRLINTYKLQDKIAESLVSEKELADLFEDAAKKVDPKTSANWIAGYLKKTLNWNSMSFNQSGIGEDSIIGLLKLFQKGKITDRNAELAIRKMVEEKKPLKNVIDKHKLGKEEIDLKPIINKVLKKNTKAVTDYKNGEEKSLNFLIGLVMKETKGQVDAKEIREALVKTLK